MTKPSRWMVVEIAEGEWANLLVRLNRDRFVEVDRVSESGNIGRTIISTYGIDFVAEEDELQC